MGCPNDQQIYIGFERPAGDHQPDHQRRDVLFQSEKHQLSLPVRMDHKSSGTTHRNPDRYKEPDRLRHFQQHQPVVGRRNQRTGIRSPTVEHHQQNMGNVAHPPLLGLSVWHDGHRSRVVGQHNLISPSEGKERSNKLCVDSLEHHQNQSVERPIFHHHNHQARPKLAVLKPAQQPTKLRRTSQCRTLHEDNSAYRKPTPARQPASPPARQQNTSCTSPWIEHNPGRTI